MGQSGLKGKLQAHMFPSVLEPPRKEMALGDCSSVTRDSQVYSPVTCGQVYSEVNLAVLHECWR